MFQIFIIALTVVFSFSAFGGQAQTDLEKRRKSCILAVQNFKNRTDDREKRRLQSECEANCGGVNTWEIGQLQPYAFQCNDEEKPYKCGNKAMCRISVMNILVDCKKSPLPSFCKTPDTMAATCMGACTPQFDNSCSDHDLRDFQQGQELCHQKNVKMGDIVPDEVAKSILLGRNKAMILDSEGKRPGTPEFYMSMFYQTVPDESISPNVVLGGDDIPRTLVDDIGGRTPPAIATNGCDWKVDVISPAVSSKAVVVGRYTSDCSKQTKDDDPNATQKRGARDGEAVSDGRGFNINKLGLYDRIDADLLAKQGKQYNDGKSKNPYFVQQIRGPASIKKRKHRYFPADHTFTNDHIHRKDRNIFNEVKRQYDNLKLDHFGEINP